MTKGLIEMIRAGFKGEVLHREPLSKHTTYRVGGEAEILVCPDSPEDAAWLFRFARREHVPVTVIGAGSNIIAPDGGIEGIVIKMKRKLDSFTLQGQGVVRVFAGASLLELAMHAAKKNLVGLEPIACIPGTVGGAVVMNAGTDEGATSDLLVRVEVITSSGRRRVFSKNELSFGYRHSLFREADWLILSADFRLRRGDGSRAAREIEEAIDKRMKKFPMEFPNAGSVFKRPKGDYAGRLIELSGCKGMRVGDAIVSERHANFIVNLGNATASDILNLISEVQKRVFEKTNVILEPEQIPLGV